jgi:hypothetical protein
MAWMVVQSACNKGAVKASKCDAKCQQILHCKGALSGEKNQGMAGAILLNCIPINE